MKQFYLLILFTFGLPATASSPDCDIQISPPSVNLANTFDLKLCFEGKSEKFLYDKFKFLFDPSQKVNACLECHINPFPTELTNLKYKPKFVEATFDELRKNMTKNILDLAVLRTNGKLSLSSNGPAQACNIEAFANSSPKLKECFKSLNSLAGPDIV